MLYNVMFGEGNSLMGAIMDLEHKIKNLLADNWCFGDFTFYQREDRFYAFQVIYTKPKD